VTEERRAQHTHPITTPLVAAWLLPACCIFLGVLREKGPWVPLWVALAAFARESEVLHWRKGEGMQVGVPGRGGMGCKAGLLSSAEARLGDRAQLAAGYLHNLKLVRCLLCII
jgi:hypothetical protein